MPLSSCRRRTAYLVLGLTAAGACAGLAARAVAGPEVLAELLAGHRIVLLGEVHDNAAQHELRAAALRLWIAGGVRPAILMEQFDRERQLEIDVAREAADATPDSVIAAGAPVGNAGGWDWAYYRPYVALALEYRLPLVAVNVSRADARRIVAEGLEVDGFDPVVPADIREVEARAIVDGHCGRIDRAGADRLVVAQVARDQFMAHAIELQADRGAVLLAGNGHVRSDVGVPRWLSPETRRQAIAIGLREPSDGLPPNAFDRTVTTLAAERPDPCQGLR